MKGRWDLVRLSDTNNWCWFSWQVMRSIGRELEYVSEANWIAGVRADIGEKRLNGGRTN